MNMKIAGVAAGLALGFALQAQSALATTVFDQPIDSATINSGHGSYFSTSGGHVFADLFSVASAAPITDIIWYGGAYSGQPYSTFDVNFYSDVGGLPGAELASTTVTPAVSNAGLYPGYADELDEFTAAIPAFDAAVGAQYFVAISENGPNNFVWAPGQGGYSAVSLTGEDGPFASSSTSGLPGTQAFSLASSVTSAAPEPTTWVLMFLGVGFVGGALRMRRGQQAGALAI